MKKAILHPLATFFMVMLFASINLKGQVRTPTLYVTGTVMSDEKMLVSQLGTKTIEGNVVSAEINGKKTQAKTDNKGHAILDFSAIAAGLASPTIAVIKSFDKNGNLISTANTTVQNGSSGVPARPVIELLPKNILKGEAITIPGRHFGANAQLNCGNQVQETLSASDKEMTVFTNAPTGIQTVFVSTPNGVSESQMVNIYSLDFTIAKNSITPREKVLAQVHYESIPVGTRLVFTNNSPETITMTIPGGENAANECIYTVSENNGSLPVNITGILKGNFQIALNSDINNMTEPDNSNQNPINELRQSLTKLNESDQKKIFGYLPAETKCALWKDHLNESLQKPLQQNQKDLIKELDSHLTPDIFGTTTASAEFRPYAFAWYTRAKSSFTGKDTTELENMVIHLGSGNTGNALLQQANIPDCDCGVGNWVFKACPINFTCKPKSCRVNQCGFFWVFTCDGLCKWNN